MRTALTISVVVFTFMLTATFNASLPNWCANPQGNGNWIVQPLCE